MSLFAKVQMCSMQRVRRHRAVAVVHEYENNLLQDLVASFVPARALEEHERMERGRSYHLLRYL